MLSVDHFLKSRLRMSNREVHDRKKQLTDTLSNRKDFFLNKSSGNHFLEIQQVEKVYDESAVDALGLYPEQVTVSIHTGSRGLQGCCRGCQGRGAGRLGPYCGKAETDGRG